MGTVSVYSETDRQTDAWIAHVTLHFDSAMDIKCFVTMRQSVPVMRQSHVITGLVRM